MKTAKLHINPIEFWVWKELERKAIAEFDSLDISTAFVRTTPTLLAKNFKDKAAELINSQYERSDYRIVEATDESINDGGNKDINLLQKFN